MAGKQFVAVFFGLLSGLLFGIGFGTLFGNFLLNNKGDRIILITSTLYFFVILGGGLGGWLTRYYVHDMSRIRQLSYGVIPGAILGGCVWLGSLSLLTAISEAYKSGAIGGASAGALAGSVWGLIMGLIVRKKIQKGKKEKKRRFNST